MITANRNGEPAAVQPQAATTTTAGPEIHNPLVIFNPTAGRRRRARLRRALAALDRVGIVCRVAATAERGDALCLARDVPDDCSHVIGAGGDGTLGEIINGLVERGRQGRSVPILGVLPLGTANVLAEELGLGNRGADPVETLRMNRVSRVTLGHASTGGGDEHIFTLMAGVGFDARVVRRVTPALKRRLGKAGYVAATVAEWVTRSPRLEYRVAWDGGEERAVAAVICNARYYGGRFVLAEGAGLCRPDLDLCLFTCPGRLAALRYLSGMLAGRLENARGFRVVKARWVRVTHELPSGEVTAGDPVQIDGDQVGDLPLCVRAEGASLNVVVARWYFPH